MSLATPSSSRVSIARTGRSCLAVFSLCILTTPATPLTNSRTSSGLQGTISPMPDSTALSNDNFTMMTTRQGMILTLTLTLTPGPTMTPGAPPTPVATERTTMTDTTTILIVGTIGITTTPTMTAAPVSATLIATGNRATDAAPMTHENATLVA